MKNNSQKLPQEYLMAIQRSREDFVAFEIATDPQYDPNWHHNKIGAELEHIEKSGDRDYKILIVTVPPRHGKSQQCSIDFPAWYFGRNPVGEIIAASYSAELAQDFGSKTRNKVDSPSYKMIFPGTVLRDDEKARGRWRTDKGGSYVAVGVGGPITGRGAKILFIDDPIKNREEAESQVYRDKVWGWFTSTAFTRLSPGGVVIIILTRWHADDLAGRILDNQELAKRTKVMKFPAIANQDGTHRKKGEALWPTRYPLSALEEIKSTIGPYDFASLYQCSPITSESQEFKPEWYKYISETELDSMRTTNYLSVDTAMSKMAHSDYCGFVDNSVDKEQFWNIRAWRARLGPEELVDNLFALHVKRKYSKIGIERTAYLDGLKPFLDSEQRKRNIFLPIVELDHKQTAKEIRIRGGLIPRYASGSVRHVEDRSDALEEEQASFPNGINDDVLDAEAYQTQLVEAPKKSVHVFRKVVKRKI